MNKAGERVQAHQKFTSRADNFTNDEKIDM